jgi:hypothetical protein
MSTNIVPFDSGKVPASILSIFGDPSTNDIVGNRGGGGGFPVISIKGKVFHITRGGEKTLITKPGEDDPAASIEVVLVRANPNNSKVYYANGYQEGSDAKPACYSNNGGKPEADSQEPQAKTCATCQHNQWGSRITESGKKGKACTDSCRIAVATVDTPNDPMLVRVPAASLKALTEYGKIVAARGVRPEACVTRIGFDYSVAHPALTFKPVGLIGDADTLQEIKDVRDGELVAQIVGIKPTPPADAPLEESASDAAPVPAKAAAAPKPAAPKPAAPAADAIEKAVAAAAATKKVSVAVEPPAAQSKTSSLEAEIGGLIESMDFDD